MAIRTCAGCRRTDEKEKMLRVARTTNGVKLDPRQNLPGRGAYVHHDAACRELAIKRGGLSRTLRCAVTAALFEEARNS